jgi:hypothetical protein
MAFENLRPHRPFIEQLKKDGKSLAEVVDALAEKRCATTPGTLSRFLKEIGSPYRPRDLTSDEKPIVDQTVLLTEIFAEVQGAKDEQRAVLEQFAGKLAVLTATVEDFEKQLVKASPQAPVLRRIWLRAFAVTAAANAMILLAVWYFAQSG